MRLELIVALLSVMVSAQTPASRIPRMPDGKPNLNGIWQTMNTANWDLETHGPAMAPVVARYGTCKMSVLVISLNSSMPT